MTPQLIDPLPDAHTVTVFGLGWSGAAAATLLRRLGKRVIVTDTRHGEALARNIEQLAAQRGLPLDEGVEVRSGQHAHHHSDAVVMTQSARHHDPFVRDTLDAGIPIIPEFTLAARALDPQHVALITIGGTDGKTTTTKLTHHLAAAQRRAYVGGNSWPPLSAVALEAIDDLRRDPLPPGQRALMIAEVSAFQIPPWHGLSPSVAAVTNVAEDHVDEYFEGDMSRYVAAKRGPTELLSAGQLAVLNVDDPRVRQWEADILARGARVARTSLSARAIAEHPDAAYRHNGELRLRWGGVDQGLSAYDALPLVGDHNAENVLTATASLLPFNLDISRTRDALMSFAPPPHRLQHLGQRQGVAVYDDSKATNVHASLAGLAAFGARPLVAIVGGVDKGLDLDHWVATLSARARHVVVIGELRRRLRDDYADKLPQASHADSLKDAVEQATRAAQPGDVLILSPACSSFDMFASYADRGRQFQDLIKPTLDPSER